MCCKFTSFYFFVYTGFYTLLLRSTSGMLLFLDEMHEVHSNLFSFLYTGGGGAGTTYNKSPFVAGTLV